MRMNAFVTKDGTRIATIEELFEKLDSIDDGIFSFHLNRQKNDFASWVEHSVGDKFLASAMRQAANKQELKRVLFMHLFK